MSWNRQAYRQADGSYRVVNQLNQPIYVNAVPRTTREQDRTRANRGVHEPACSTTKPKGERRSSGKSSELNKQLSEEIVVLKARVEELERDRTVYAHNFQEASQREQSLQITIQQLTEQAEESEKTKEKLYVANKKLEAENAAVKDRLSRMMGMKLSDNNPDITDLSDKNRPTKLAEKFAELYDNQWTDAYEVVSETAGEKQRIDTLLDLLWNIREFCTMKAGSQIDELTRAFMMMGSQNRQLSQGFVKQLKDFRKANAESATDSVFELYKEDMRARNDPKCRVIEHPKVQSFVKECLELCWLMAVQDPPMVLGGRKTADTVEKFDTSVYKPYMTTGAYFDYLVWPPLYLHENGSLLEKGVAEGKKGKGSKEITPKRTQNLKSVPGAAVHVTNTATSKPSKEMARSYGPTKSNKTDFSRTFFGSGGVYENFQF